MRLLIEDWAVYFSVIDSFLPQILVVVVAILLGLANYLTFKHAGRSDGVEITRRGVPTSAYDFLAAAIGLIYAIFVSLFRFVKSLPVIVTGTNPYIFDRDCRLCLSLYSKVKIFVFGTTVVFVSLYVFSSISSMLVKVTALNGYGSGYIMLFSLVASIIVYCCDMIILSYPKVSYDVYGLVLVERWKQSSLGSFFSFFVYGPVYCIRVVWIKLYGAIFTVIRFVLALSIASLVLVPTYIISNTASIVGHPEKIKIHEDGERKKELDRQNKIIQDDRRFASRYIDAYNEYLSIYNDYYSAAAKLFWVVEVAPNVSPPIRSRVYHWCFDAVDVASAGIRSRIAPIQGRYAEISGPGVPCVSFNSFQSLLAWRNHLAEMRINLESSVDSSRKKLDALESELLNSADIVKQRGLMDRLAEYRADFNGRPDASGGDRAGSGGLDQQSGSQQHPSDVAGSGKVKVEFGEMIRLFRDYIMHMYNSDRQMFYFEALVNAPLIMILLLFEMLPVLGKTFFPSSGFERMCAIQDLDHSLRHSYAHNESVVSGLRDKFSSLFNSVEYRDFTSKMGELDFIQKEKGAELKEAMDRFKEAFEGYMKELTCFPVLSSVLFTLFFYIIGVWCVYIVNKVPR